MGRCSSVTVLSSIQFKTITFFVCTFLDTVHYCMYVCMARFLQGNIFHSVPLGVLMWEIFTEGRTPFENKSNPEVVDEITRGHRLYRPHLASKTIYKVMYSCWHEVVISMKLLSQSHWERLSAIECYCNMFLCTIIYKTWLFKDFL